MARKKKNNPDTDQDQPASERQRENGGAVPRQKYPVDAEGYEVLPVSAPLPAKEETWLEEFKDNSNVSPEAFDGSRAFELNCIAIRYWSDNSKPSAECIEYEKSIAADSHNLYLRLAPRGTHEEMIAKSMIVTHLTAQQLVMVSALAAGNLKTSSGMRKEAERYFALFDKFQASLDRHRMQEQKRKTEVKRQEVMSQKIQAEELKRKKLELEIELLEEKAKLLLPDPEPIRMISDESANLESDLQVAKEDPALEKQRRDKRHDR